jgi:phospholipid/cholesterol/gamma-HCH transport system substrate-binding protein
MSTPFRERNPVIIGAISIAVIVLTILLAFNAEKLPIIGGGDTYYADFAEAGGLKANDEVRIAGVRVGKVDSVALDGDHVKVALRIDSGADFGTTTRAQIKIKTLLGAMYVALQPAGPGQLAKGSEIPVSRTQSPYDVVQAFSGLARTSERINTGQLARSLTTLADLTRNTPTNFRHALSGVSALSGNLASRDSQISTLLTNLRNVSGILRSRDQDIVGLMRDSDVLFRALYKRRQAIHELLHSTSQLSNQLTKLVRQSRADLKPALTHLNNVVDVLNKNSDNIDQSIRLMAPFYRVFANTLGDGPWFDTYIQNIPPVPQVGG